MNEQDEDRGQDQLPEGAPEPVKPLPLVRVRGEGFITRKNGEVVPFTIEGEG